MRYGAQQKLCCCMYLRCDTKLVFGVMVCLDNNESHATLLPHDAGELFDVFRPVKFGRSGKRVSYMHTTSTAIRQVHLC
jgi:hypothetical protein